MKKILLLVIIVALGVGVFIYYSIPRVKPLTQQEKEKTLAEQLGRKVDLQDKEVAENKQYRGKFISFKYPGDAIIYEHRESGSSGDLGSLENFSYDIKSPRAVFNYEVIEGVKNLEDNPHKKSDRQLFPHLE